MMKTNELYDLAENNSIPVYSFNLPLTSSVSISDKDGNCAIGIDPFAIQTTSDERVFLAHELGHCITGSFYNRYSDFDIRAKHEHRADKWAIKKLVPKDELKEAVAHGITEPWDLAEYFDVTEDFIKKAVKLYGDVI